MTSCVCPMCGFAGNLVVFTNDVDARHFAALMGKVPPEIAEVLGRYLSLFTPAKHKLTWPRARRVLEELLPDIQRGAIARRHQQWNVPVKVWARALELMHEQRANLQLPLRGHGYLYDVIASQVEKADAAAERAIEDQRRQGNRSGSAAAPVQVDQAAGEATRLAHIQNVVQRIRSVQDEDRRKRLPVRTVEHIANSYRDQFGDVVVDAALQQFKTPV